jgi:sugar phosphate isomerase/epimerase
MHAFRLAVATRCFDAPLRPSLRLAADCGAEGVQFDLRQELQPAELDQTGRRDLQHLLDELGLRVAGTTFALRRALTDEHELDRRIAAIKQAMSWSYALKSTVLTFRLGRLPKESDSKEARLLTEILQDLAREANHVGVTLALTPHHDSAHDLQQLLTSIETGPIGVDFDPAQFVMAGHDAVADLRTLHNFTAHVQLRDAIAEIDGTLAETPVGAGAVPWLEVLATLGEMDYTGWLTAIRSQGGDKAGDLRRAIVFVRRLLLGG